MTRPDPAFTPTAADRSSWLWIDAGHPVAEPLRIALDCYRRVALPSGGADDPAPPDDAPHRRLTEWRDEHIRSASPVAGVVLCALGAGLDPDRVAPLPTEVIDLDPSAWRRRLSDPLKDWFTALQLAGDLCRDGGSIVLVLDDPSPLDGSGHGATVALTDALTIAARSLAMSTAHRNVRVNTVGSPVIVEAARTQPFLGVAPPDRYPGSPQRELADAVRMLLGDASAGITGRHLPVDFGRSWT